MLGNYPITQLPTYTLLVGVMAHETVFIGFGSNRGDRFDYCDRAVTLLGLLPSSQVTGISSLYETEPVHDAGQPGPGWFLNGEVRLDTELPIRRLLETCREVEWALGRDQEQRRGPRTLDLDLLFYGAQRVELEDLVVPHPRLHLRRFVLTPLVELDPDWRHPLLEHTTRELLESLGDPSQVRRLEVSAGSRYGFRPACNTQTPGA